MPQTPDPMNKEGKGSRWVTGTFFPDATNPITVTPATGGVSGVVGGPGWTGARTGVGTVTLTFENKYPLIISKTLTAQWNATNVDFTPKFGAFTAATATTPATLLIHNMTAAVLTEFPAANANNSISFQIEFGEYEKII